MKDPQPLPVPECRRLLAQCPLGRLIFTEGAMPTARPVNFFVHHNDIVVRAARDGILAGLDEQVVALEIDSLDSGSEAGWSVVAVGKAELVRDPERLALYTDPHQRPWVQGEESVVLRIPIKIVTGRRLSSAVCAVG
ncbi:pyridoxamine 5'-phosphate oxidase family protein [Amycolatopsis cynarae]|uniref:Pyridoxamine 5'-phosphate oxidase family protein n=1 Tax=Amycolatopsis cynarae TaxID=2995223 RepID=A0ABY7AVD8_9PSEU|nr:pyridoxamine 5'-phosphate oxidase family protein [Amycolatopsis sp. HUAS 11-8]WAL63949.1 pyridoxamine 5'-phosphate oxidase family protein [Amycolatopsis sp. HUAS 11-8]